MISRSAKALFFQVAAPIMRLNGALYRRFRAPRKGLVKVHLGPGQANYLDGWINVDANMFTAKCDVWADFRGKLPFRDASVDVTYSHHVIEHLPDALLAFHFQEIFRCLKPGGAFRIGGPSGDGAVQKFQEGDSAWFSDFPDNRASLGGRLANFLFCRGEHLTILTFSWLEELARAAGFPKVSRCQPVTETNFPELIDRNLLEKEWESTPECPHTLIVEGRKPAVGDRPQKTDVRHQRSDRDANDD
jgi:SAM-dependent methyltransferase